MCSWFHGLHLPHTASVFEALVLAILGQQIATTVARIIRTLLIETYGPRQTFDGEVYYSFPRPETLGALPVEELRGKKLSQRKAEYVQGIALATPAEPVHNTHLVGVVTGIGNGVVTLTDDDGSPFVVKLPPGIAARIGEFLTIVSSLDDDSEGLAASDVASVEDVLDRLADKIEDAVEKAETQLQGLLRNNGNEYLTALVGALGGASEDVRQDLEHAVETAQAGLQNAFDDAGVEGPYVKVRGFVTESTSTSITIERPTGVEVTLQVIDATKIEGSIAVGAFVSVKHSLNNVAAKIEVEDDQITFKGIVTSATTTALTLHGGRVFTLTDATEIDGELSVGVRVAVEVHPAAGDFVVHAVVVHAVKVEQSDQGRGSTGESQDLNLEFKGTVTAMATTSITVDGLEVVLDAGTEVDGELEQGARVEVEAVFADGLIVGSHIEVLDEEEKVEDDESDIEFKGKVTFLSPTSIEVDGAITVLVGPATKIKGPVTPGAVVEIKAKSENGNLVAISIRSKISKSSKLEYEGSYVTYVPFKLLVLEDGTEFVLNSYTEIEGTMSQSVVVKVKAIELADGTFLATEIEAKKPAEDDHRKGNSKGHDDKDED